MHINTTKSISGSRAAIVTGIRGLGKTQLAVEFAYRYGRYFTGGVYWISFEDENYIADNVAAIGGAYGMELYLDADQLSRADKIGRVKQAWQSPERRLLIFDNCESEHLLAEWMPNSGGSVVFATSRNTIWSATMPVQSMPLGLFTLKQSNQVLQNLAPHLNNQQADMIGRELERFPLALYLAGSYLNRYRQITPSQYISQLHDHKILEHVSLKGYGSSTYMT